MEERETKIGELSEVAVSRQRSADLNFFGSLRSRRDTDQQRYDDEDRRHSRRGRSEFSTDHTHKRHSGDDRDNGYSDDVAKYGSDHVSGLAAIGTALSSRPMVGADPPTGNSRYRFLGRHIKI